MKENRLVIRWHPEQRLSKEARLLWEEANPEKTNLQKKIENAESTVESLRKIEKVTSMVDLILEKFAKADESVQKKADAVKKAKADLAKLVEGTDVPQGDIESALNAAKITALTVALDAKIITEEELGTLLKEQGAASEASSTATPEAQRQSLKPARPGSRRAKREKSGATQAPRVEEQKKTVEQQKQNPKQGEMPETPEAKLALLDAIKERKQEISMQIAQANRGAQRRVRTRRGYKTVGPSTVELQNRNPQLIQLNKEYWKVRKAWELQTGGDYSMHLKQKQDARMDRLYALNGTTREEAQRQSEEREAARQSREMKSRATLARYNRNRSTYSLYAEENSKAERGRQIMANTYGNSPDDWRGSGLTGTDVAYQSHLLRAAARGDTVGYVPGSGYTMIVPKGFKATRYNSETGSYDKVDPMPAYRKYVFQDSTSGGGNQERRPLSGYQVDDPYRDAYTGRRKNGGQYDKMINSHIDRMGGDAYMREQEKIGGYWNEVNEEKLANDFADLHDDPEYKRIMDMKNRRERYYGKGTDNPRYYVDQLEKLRKMRQNENFSENLRFDDQGREKLVLRSLDLLREDIFKNTGKPDELGMMTARIDIADPDSKDGWKFVGLIEDPRMLRGGGLKFFGNSTKFNLEQNNIRPEILRYSEDPSETGYGNVRGIRLNFSSPGKYRVNGKEVTIEAPIDASPQSAPEIVGEGPLKNFLDLTKTIGSNPDNIVSNEARLVDSFQKILALKSSEKMSALRQATEAIVELQKVARGNAAATAVTEKLADLLS